MTETGSGIVYDGRALDGVELRIGDGSHGAATGRSWCAGPCCCAATATAPIPRTGDGWLPTGDAGRIGPDGTLAVFGRMAEVIVTGGEKVWPAPVERVLGRHPGVDQVAVWKRPDPEWGERVVAWVVPGGPGPPAPASTSSGTWWPAELPRWAAPRELVVTDRLPRTAGGKVTRDALT